MPVSPDASLFFGPHYEGLESVPLDKLLSSFIHNRFDAAKCQAVLESLISKGEAPARYFDLAAFKSGGVIATDALLFPVCTSWEFVLADRKTDQSFRSVFDEKDVENISDLIRFILQSDDVDALLSQLDIGDPKLMARLLCSAPYPAWPIPEGPGIYRREHASVLVCSDKTSLLIDPVAMNRMLPNIDRSPIDQGVSVDAILITHPHADHWHLPSILLHPKPVPLIVPEVKATSILTADHFGRTVSAVGQKALDPPWWTTLTIGDVEIDVLPFYGEQPTRVSPGPVKTIRSWGNCYRINTPSFSALLLVDSGADPEGDMLEVVSASVKRRGPVDMVLACLREFAAPFFGGLATYWITLPFSRLQELFDQMERGVLPSVTAGARGVIELCQAAHARYFLPYADGFEGVGQPITDIGWGGGEPSEVSTILWLQEEFRRLKAGTQALNWMPGDAARWRDHSAAIQSPAKPH